MPLDARRATASSARIPLGRVRKVDRERPADEDERLEHHRARSAATGCRSRCPRPASRRSGAAGAREVALVARPARRRRALRAPAPRPRSTDARWAADGTLELAGELEPDVAAGELVFYDERPQRAHAFPVEREPGSGRFTAALTPARIETLAGPLPLSPGTWRAQRPRRRARRRWRRRSLAEPLDAAAAAHRRRPQAVRARASGRDGRARARRPARPRRRRARALQPAPAARDRLRRPPRPSRCATPSSTRASAGASTPTARARSTRSSCAAARRSSTCGWSRDGHCAVAGGRDRPARGQPRVPRGARRRALRRLQRPLPDLVRAAATTRSCLQTWHGTPLKRLGFDVSDDAQDACAASSAAGTQQVPTGSTSSPPTASRRRSCARAYAIEGEMLETGLPAQRRARAARPRRARRARCARGSGIPEGVRTVLYAPTYRDQRRRPPRPLPAGPAPGRRAPARGGRARTP